MIRIKSQSGTGQYDEDGRQITYWDEKKCSWIVLPEFENERIDWYGEDSDFPAGCTLAEYEASNPNWDKMPDISVTWYWNTKEACIMAFGHPSSFLPIGHKNRSDYWDIQKYPYAANRQWGYIEYNEQEAIQQLGKYCSWHKHADRTVVTYNGKVLFDGKLTD